MPVVSVEPRRLRLNTPLQTGWGRLDTREVLQVRLTWPDGSFGEGEAAPLEPYDGVSMRDVRAALEHYGSVLGGMDDAPAADLLAACVDRRPLPQALAAVDLACWDRAGRQAGLPVAALIAPAAPAAVAVNATITAQDRAGAAVQATRAAAAGFACVKVKVGVGDDPGRLAAIRSAVGPYVAIRVDANGAWQSLEEALAKLRAMLGTGIELAEEPVHGVEPLRALRDASAIPIAMDETAALLGAVEAGAADAVCLKISRCGGISGLLDQARAARAAGAQVYVSSTLDGPAGIAAGLHAAAVLAASGSLPACGLATLELFEGAGDLLPVIHGYMPVPEGPGLLGPGSAVARRVS